MKDVAAMARFGMLLVLLLILPVTYSSVTTNPTDTLALQAFHKTLQDPSNKLASWKDNNPCGGWSYVFCSSPSGPSNITFVTELRLFGLNLGGTLAPELGNLTSLIYLDVMWNHMTGSIPASFSKLTNLYLLLLNGNQFTGILPPELGTLSKLNRIQIDQNNISGPVPNTFGGLTNIKHLHMNNNSLNGSIPKELGSLPNVVHILLDNNQITGELPMEIHNAPNLLIIQLDNNRFASNATIPVQWGNITTLLKLSLHNCGLTGTLPDLSGLTSLEVLDLGSNNFTGHIPNGTALPVNLTSFDLSNNQLDGQIPVSIGNLQKLDLLNLRSNRLSGAVPSNLGTANSFQTATSAIKPLIDLQNNQLTSAPSLVKLESNSTTKVRLAGNPAICGPNSNATNPLCVANYNADIISYDTTITPEYPSDACTTCQPITVGYRLKSPGFSMFDRYDAEFVSYLSGGLNLSTSQVVLKNYTWQLGPRLQMSILLLPADNNTFNQSEFDRLYQTFANWGIPDSTLFGPYELLSFNPRGLQGTKSKKGLSAGAIAGIVLGVAIFAILVTCLLLFLLYRRKQTPAQIRAQLARITAKRHPDLKVAGVRAFSYEELASATNNFSDENVIGQGGYGKVYRGNLDSGKQLVAIKRAQEGSLQGAHEFYTEIELLSRVHHRNLVILVGYCDDVGEQMLVYEFMSGGTLRDHLSPMSDPPLDFPTRVRIALGSARGILYLHTEADPPIFHRDIKASNILLDARKVAKVADFGLSRLAPVPDLEGATPGHVSTVVKGTPGYLDPEYFLTHKLTDKSDVYSFGVVLLELITGLQPIYKGKNLVREAKLNYDAGEFASMVDPRIGRCPPETLEPLVRLAVSCCREMPDARPNMAEVVRDLEEIARNTADLFPDSFSLDLAPSNRVDPAYLPTSYQFNSSADTSELMSGTNMNVTPR